LRDLGDHSADFGNSNVRVGKIRGRDFGDPIAQAIVLFFRHGSLYSTNAAPKKRYLCRSVGAGNTVTPTCDRCKTVLRLRSTAQQQADRPRPSVRK
jgi:hypothetical protein